jgi:hypothetical protein
VTSDQHVTILLLNRNKRQCNKGYITQWFSTGGPRTISSHFYAGSSIILLCFSCKKYMKLEHNGEVVSARLFVRIFLLQSHWSGFDEIWYWGSTLKLSSVFNFGSYRLSINPTLPETFKWPAFTQSAHGIKTVVSPCFFNWVPRYESVLASRGIAPCILDLGTRWLWVVSFTTRPFYPQEKSPWFQFDRRLGGPQSRSGHCSEK